MEKTMSDNVKDFFELEKTCSNGDVMEYDNNPDFRITKGLKKGVFCDNPDYTVDVHHLLDKKWRIVK